MLYVLQGSPYPSVKSPGIGWTLKIQTKLLVVDSPMVKNRVDFVVDQVLLYDAIQNNLMTDHFTFRNKHRQKKAC